MQVVEVFNTKFFLIVHFYEVKATGGHARTSQTPVMGLKYGRNLGRQQLPRSDIQQCADDRTYHVLQKPVARDAEYPEILLAVPSGFENRPDAVFYFGCRSAERCEIVCAEKAARRVVYSGSVDPVGKRVHIATLEWTDNVLPPNVVLVSL